MLAWILHAHARRPLSLLNTKGASFNCYQPSKMPCESPIQPYLVSRFEAAWAVWLAERILKAPYLVLAVKDNRNTGEYISLVMNLMFTMDMFYPALE